MPETVDLCFTSPPYFNTEMYSDESSQSWVRYPTVDEWNDQFLRTTIANCRQALVPDGTLILNVADVKSHPSLVVDTITIAQEEGFIFTETLRLALSSISSGGHKYEPVLIFQKA